MRTVLVLATVVALAYAGTVPAYKKYDHVKTESVDAAIVHKQYQVLELLETPKQLNFHANYYKIGKDYDIKAHIADYNKESVETFFKYYEYDFIPKYNIFTIFNEKMMEQAKALYDVFYFAKDFEAFYKAAAWARVHVNSGLFVYTFYVAAVQRVDTKDIVLPAVYEVFPQYFANSEVFDKIFYSKIRGEPFEEFPQYGIFKEGNDYIYFSNYSDIYTYGDEHKLAYLTEDIGWNAYYFYFHTLVPFWEEGEHILNGAFKDRRGEIVFNFYKNLLARYYLERLSNGLGEIPMFSWYQPFKYGFRPYLTANNKPYAQRTENYVMQNEHNLDDLRFVRNYEDMFLTYLEQGQFKSHHKQVDFTNSKSINFVGNFWQSTPDLYEKQPKNRYYSSYEHAARRILGGAPTVYSDQWYNVFPTALDYYQTSLRDPAFYQIYNKIYDFVLKYKEYLQPYTQENLHYVGVKVNNVEVSKLETFFDFYTFNATNNVIFDSEELEYNQKHYLVAQPRLNHESFKVKFSVKSDVEEEATFKVFVGPKYDSYGYEIKFEDNWMNFVRLDWFTHKLSKGENVIERGCDEFFFYKEDSLPTFEIYNYLSQGKLPHDMIYKKTKMPSRLILPRGTKGGFPLQFFVVVYKNTELPKEYENFKSYLIDDKPLGYPLDRPVSEFFIQPNMYVKDVFVYHKGSEYPTFYDVAEHTNKVAHH